jgi:hypothetical protein
MGAGIRRDQARWNRSKALAAARGGARADKPRWVRILAIAVGSKMAATIVKEPPQFGQCSRSISKTRLSNWAQRIRAGAEGASVVSPWADGGSVALAGALGMIWGRSLALRPRRAKQAPPWAWLPVRARHGSE